MKNNPTGQNFFGENFLGIICRSTAAFVLIVFTKVDLSYSQSQVQVKTNRYLQVEKVSGTVFLRSKNDNRPARNGDRLLSIGDQIITNANSTVTLSIDTGVGVVNVFENTIVRLTSLQVTSDNGRITNLQVPKGKVRLQIRKFTNASSQFNLQTPAVVAGVRGTEYVVNVKDDGRTVLSTFEGAVRTEAQNTGVLVKSGFQNQTIVGEPPSIPTPINEDGKLSYQVLKLFEHDGRKVILVGNVDFANTVSIDGSEQNIDRNGQFRSVVATNTIYRNEIQVIVTTPSGKKYIYDLLIY